MMVVEDKMVYWEFVWKLLRVEGLGRVEGLEVWRGKKVVEEGREKEMIV